MKKIIIILCTVVTALTITVVLIKNRIAENTKKQREEEIYDVIEFDKDDHQEDIVTQEVEGDKEEVTLQKETVVIENQKTEEVIDTNTDDDIEEEINFNSDDNDEHDPNYQEDETPIAIPPEEIVVNKKQEVVIEISDGNNSTPVILD